VEILLPFLYNYWKTFILVIVVWLIDLVTTFLNRALFHLYYFCLLQNCNIINGSYLYGNLNLHRWRLNIVALVKLYRWLFLLGFSYDDEIDLDELINDNL